MDNPLDFSRFKNFLHERLYWDPEKIEITQIAGGYSNLTFMVETPVGRFAMRRAPFGEKISKAHDMTRESMVLEALARSGYQKAPKPVILFEDEDLNGSPLMVMEWIDGIVLGNKLNENISLTDSEFRKLSENSLDSLIELHLLELNNSGLIHLGKPEGYVERQVLGWTDRYFRSKTKEFPEMEKVAQWLIANIPSTENIGFIHNDYKYDNLVLNREEKSEIKSVLDWEMATVGDPLMDLGTTLAYWCQEDDLDTFKMFNMTHLPGNLTRKEVITYYDIRTPYNLSNILYYYVFGIFKVGVIAQQIYKRFFQGFTQGAKFASLIHAVEAAGKKAENSIRTEKI